MPDLSTLTPEAREFAENFAEKVPGLRQVFDGRRRAHEEYEAKRDAEEAAGREPYTPPTNRRLQESDVATRLRTLRGELAEHVQLGCVPAGTDWTQIRRDGMDSAAELGLLDPSPDDAATLDRIGLPCVACLVRGWASGAESVHERALHEIDSATAIYEEREKHMQPRIDELQNEVLDLRDAIKTLKEPSRPRLGNQEETDA